MKDAREMADKERTRIAKGIELPKPNKSKKEKILNLMVLKISP